MEERMGNGRGYGATSGKLAAAGNKQRGQTHTKKAPTRKEV